jgi:hypothetical protein
MSNATPTTVAKVEKKKAGCCGGADSKDGDRPTATVTADEAKPASHAAHDHSKHESGAGCCGGGKARK